MRVSNRTPAGDERRVMLPDLLGLSVAEVRRIAAEMPLTVEISGRGRAVDQQPPPGTVVSTRTSRIHVRFAKPDAGEET